MSYVKRYSVFFSPILFWICCALSSYAIIKWARDIGYEFDIDGETWQELAVYESIALFPATIAVVICAFMIRAKSRVILLIGFGSLFIFETVKFALFDFKLDIPPFKSESAVDVIFLLTTIVLIVYRPSGGGKNHSDRTLK